MNTPIRSLPRPKPKPERNIDHATKLNTLNEVDTHMNMIACPVCQKQVSSQAVSCPNCGHPIAGKPTAAPVQVTVVMPKWSKGVAAVLSFIIPGAGQMYKGPILNGLLWLLFVVIGYALFIVPGVILHVCCIAGAAAGDPYK